MINKISISNKLARNSMETLTNIIFLVNIFQLKHHSASRKRILIQIIPKAFFSIK